MPTRQFSELHPKDQQIKQTKKLCIEKYWECAIEDCLPPAIRPRVEEKKGSKKRAGDSDIKVEKWWNWSVELLKSLEELASMTEGELHYAQELLEIEVEQRQDNPKSNQRKILELLLGDTQKVVDEQRKRLAVRYSTDGMDMDMGEASQQVGQAGYPLTLALQHYAQPYAEAPASSVAQQVHAQHYTEAPASSVAGQAHALQLRMRAARLRAEALRQEAEAAELESKMFELRQQE